METTYLILVCNASKALLYLTDKKYPKKPLQFITELTNPKSQLKGIDLVTDRPGRYQKSSVARSAYEEPIEPKEKEKDHFAKQLAEHLEGNYKQRLFQQLIIIAPAHFFGLLEKHLANFILASIIRVIQKDYTYLPEIELRTLLQQKD